MNYVIIAMMIVVGIVVNNIARIDMVIALMIGVYDCCHDLML